MRQSALVREWTDEWVGHYRGLGRPAMGGLCPAPCGTAGHGHSPVRRLVAPAVTRACTGGRDESRPR
jgi:hypothetical protein